YSPIISERQRARIDSIVRAAVAAGGECLTGGNSMDHPGYFYEPTLIADVDQANPAIVEEIFGPVLTVQT
ncbi:MAG: aldehyde dehydrogenase family protein, partial [Mesorhizobium sp.]